MVLLYNTQPRGKEYHDSILSASGKLIYALQKISSITTRGEFLSAKKKDGAATRVWFGEKIDSSRFRSTGKAFEKVPLEDVWGMAFLVEAVRVGLKPSCSTVYKFVSSIERVLSVKGVSAKVHLVLNT